jgi:NAD+ diphosphatase
VIVAVESEDGEKLLLGANANWHGRMYSCFAGFVEAGESLELTVHREIEEEAGVRLDSVRYVGSQPWPYPRSLMVGFRATASDERRARPDGEEIIDVRWFTRDEIGSALRGDGPVGLPGPASIARALIQGWYEERVPAALSERVVE